MGTAQNIHTDDDREQAWQIANGIANAITAATSLEQLDAVRQRQRPAFERLKERHPDLARGAALIVKWRREDLERGITP